MKTLYSTAVSTVLALLTLSSCTLQEPDNFEFENVGSYEIPALSTPTYEAESGLYEITSEDAPYSSIELTAGGNYFVKENGFNYPIWDATNKKSKGKDAENGASVRHTVDFAHNAGVFSTTRAQYFDGIYFGTFTQIGENTFYLDGFGTVTIIYDGGNACDIVVDNGSGPVSMGAVRKENYSNSERTDAICRTWNMEKMHIQMYQYNLKVFDEEFTADTYDEYDAQEGWPSQIIFTKAGNYIVIYGMGDNRMLDISSWKWSNEAKGILRFSWDLSNIDNPDASGIVQCLFSGNQLTITETQTEGPMKMRIIYYMEQAE